jgi:hypothetical protein
MKQTELSDNEILSEKTGEENDQSRGTSIEPDIDEIDVATKQANSYDYELSPLEISKKSYYEAEKKLIDKKTLFVGVGVVCIKIFTGVVTLAIAILGIYWAYNLSNIAEPMGALKEKSINLEKDIEILKAKLDEVDDNLINTREEFIKSNFSNK